MHNSNRVRSFHIYAMSTRFLIFSDRSAMWPMELLKLPFTSVYKKVLLYLEPVGIDELLYFHFKTTSSNKLDKFETEHFLLHQCCKHTVRQQTNVNNKVSTKVRTSFSPRVFTREKHHFYDNLVAKLALFCSEHTCQSYHLGLE